MSTVLGSLNESFEREKAETKKCCADVVGFLSHDTSTTRRQLVRILRLRADMIERGVNTDSFFENILGEKIVG